MTLEHIKTYLDSVNLTHFAERHKLSRRTLVRLRNDHGTPSNGTMHLVSLAIKSDKRRLKKEE